MVGNLRHWYVLHSEMTDTVFAVICVLLLFQRKMVIEDETEFCSEELLHNVLQCKVSPFL